jgi:tRNA threonylcarbamoyladenosine biosynthesis protein TsaB
MKIVGIETALGLSEVALLDELNSSSPRTSADEVLYSENVLRLLRVLLEESETSLNDLGGIAVSIGPGSFTGLRIGLSVAKGLASAASLPLVGVSTLDALAGSVIYSGETKAGSEFLAVIDAKRNEYYCAPYRNDNGNVVQVLGPRVLPGSEMCRVASEGSGIIVFGNGRMSSTEQWIALTSRLGPRLKVVERGKVVSPAAAVALLGVQKFRRGEFADLASLEPSYLKEFPVHSPS